MIQTFIDCDRVAAVIVGGIVALQVLLLFRRVVNHRPRPVQFGAILATLAGILTADMVIAITSASNLGQPLTWQLPVSSGTLWLFLFGLGRFLHHRPARRLQGAATVPMGPYPPPSQVARRSSLIGILAVVALLGCAVLGGSVMVTKANGRAVVAKARADVAQARGDRLAAELAGVQKQIDRSIADNDVQFCEQETLIAGLPTSYPPPSTPLGEALTTTLLRIQASGEHLSARFHCPKEH